MTWFIIFLTGVLGVAFHIWALAEGWWWTPIASNWTFIDTADYVTFWITGVGMTLVIFFEAYCIFRFTGKEGQKAAQYNPESVKLETWLFFGTTALVVAMLLPGLWAWDDFVNPPKGASKVEVVAEQWTWSYRFPGKDGVFGTTNARNWSDKNPFGLNPDDPKGQDDILVEDSEVHLPLGIPVIVSSRSKDVLHDFSVPHFRAKTDAVPGMVTSWWFTPTRTGEFNVLCFELCGTGHHTMRGMVVIDEENVFQAWLKEQPTFAQSMADAGTGAEDGVNMVLSEAPRAEPAERGIAQIDTDGEKAKGVF
ncbi:MAG: cytochrome c oxidase subunit II [Rhodospirillales bacterium]